jgi:hypothetical protein
MKDFNDEFESMMHFNFGGAAPVAECETVERQVKDDVLTEIAEQAAKYAADRFVAVLDGRPRHPLAPPRNYAYWNGIRGWVSLSTWLTPEQVDAAVMRDSEDFGADDEGAELGYIAAATMRKDIYDSLGEGKGYVQEALRIVGYNYRVIDDGDIGYPHCVADRDTIPARRAFAGKVLEATIAELDRRGYRVVKNHIGKDARLRRLVVLPK